MHVKKTQLPTACVKGGVEVFCIIIPNNKGNLHNWGTWEQFIESKSGFGIWFGSFQLTVLNPLESRTFSLAHCFGVYWVPRCFIGRISKSVWLALFLSWLAFGRAANHGEAKWEADGLLPRAFNRGSADVYLLTPGVFFSLSLSFTPPTHTHTQEGCRYKRNFPTEINNVKDFSEFVMSSPAPRGGNWVWSGRADCSFLSPAFQLTYRIGSIIHGFWRRRRRLWGLFPQINHCSVSDQWSV